MVFWGLSPGAIEGREEPPDRLAPGREGSASPILARPWAEGVSARAGWPGDAPTRLGGMYGHLWEEPEPCDIRLSWEPAPDDAKVRSRAGEGHASRAPPSWDRQRDPELPQERVSGGSWASSPAAPGPTRRTAGSWCDGEGTAVSKA